MLDMIDKGLQQVNSPPLVPDDQTLDLAHLFRMTLGDRGLQHEVLQLFDRQADMLVARLRESDPASMAALAHVLKGSARGIGAWQVASAAAALETACAGETDVGVAVNDLEAAVSRARAAIAGHV